MSGPTWDGAPVPYAQVARSPRMIGLLLLFLAVAAGCGLLGAWQLDRAREDAPADAEVPVALPLGDVLAPQEPFRGDLVGRPVVVEGTFGADQVAVTGRLLDGVPGRWAVAPFTVSDTGAVLVVVRGWAPEGGALPEVPDGVVTLRGRLEAGEAATSSEITSVSPAQLVNRWGGPIYSGFLVQDTPPPGLEPIPAPAPAQGWDLQNLAYAAQWWIFGGAAVLLWLRMVRDEARDRAAAAAVDGPAVDGPAVAGGLGDAVSPAGDAVSPAGDGAAAP